MKSSRTISNSERLQTLRNLLAHQRNEALARIRDFRRAQEEDAEPLPGDELDAARALAEVETHAGLIERAEYRLKAIAAALSRVEEGRYGICEGCGEDIPVDRLKVLPFAAYCVDCQSKRNHRLRQGEGSIDEPSRHLWNLPEEMDESLEKQDALIEPEERLAVRDQGPSGPEVGEFEQLPPSPTARRRGRARTAE
jgi:DnaK suppressor protein